MSKNSKESDSNLFYINQGQAHQDITEMMEKKKAKEREKRIKQNKAKKEKDFDLDTETVIQMTNKNKIEKDEEERKKITKEEKKRQKRNKKIKIVLEIIVLLGIIIGGITFSMVSPIFNIKEIQVIGNEQVSEETIISLSELKTEENIFKFIKSNIIEKIKENAYIETVKIHRKIPNKLQIEVQERHHDYSVDYLGNYAYINKQGYILEISEDSKQKPIIQGVTTAENQIEIGKRLNDDDLERLEDVIKIMNATMEYNLDTKVTSIDISDKNEYSLYLEEEKKKIHLGDNSNLSNKMLYVNAIIEKEKGKAGDVFINGDLNNKFQPYFRESLNV